jgi:exonuclease III
MNKLTLIHLNVNGLRGRLTELSVLLDEVPTDIILFNETKLRDTEPPRIKGFRVAAFRNRQMGNVRGIGGGGVAIYVACNLKVKDISPDQDDLAAVEVVLGTNEKLAVVSYYVAPNNEGPDATALDQFLTDYPACIIAGDLNCKHQFYGCRSTDRAGEELFNFVESNDMLVLNDPDQATYFDSRTNNSDILDYILASKKVANLTTNCTTGDDVGSDHLPIITELTFRRMVDRLPTIMHRPLAKCNWEEFNQQLDSNIQTVDDSQLCSQQAIDARCDVITSAVTSSLDVACPKRAILEGAFRVRKETLNLIREKRQVRRRLQKKEDPLLRTALNRLNNQIHRQIASEKQQAWEQATENLNHLQGANLWKSFKNLTGTGKSKKAVARLEDGQGLKASGDIEVAAAFGRHLEQSHRIHEGPSYCQTTKLQIDKEVQDNALLFTPCFPPSQEEQGDGHFLVEKILPDDISAVLRKMKGKTASGADEIPTVALKRASPKFVEILAQLFTICLFAGYFPASWKSAVGVMIPKPGKDHKLPGSYRPISLLSCVGKLFERVLSARLNLHLEEVKVFNPFQRAYRKGMEGGEHVYRLFEHLAAAKGKGYKTAVAALDVEKAFDAVWHNGLRHKLAAAELQLPSKLIRLLSSFLSDRKIQVKVGQARSEPVALLAGTPQGSVLSPVLFNLFVNDVPLRQSALIDSAQFADDTTTWATAKKKKTALAHLQISLRNLEPWLAKWRVKVNVKKTQLVCFGSLGAEGSITLCGETVEEQDSLKILGTSFDKRLSGKKHCKELANKAMSRVHLLRRLRGQTWGTSRQRLLVFYKQFVRPVMENGHTFSAMAKPTAIQRLRVVQNSAMRIILRAPPRSRILDMEQQTGLQDILTRLTSLKEAAVQRYSRSPLTELLNLRKQMLKK